ATVFERTVPLLARTLRARCVTGDGVDREALRAVYPLLPSYDFSRNVLEAAPDAFSVLTVPWCGWSDLGTPLRVLRCLHRSERVESLRLRASRARSGRVDLGRVDRLLAVVPRA